MAWHVRCAQVTAYQVIQSAGTTGHLPTTVQFNIANPSDQAVRRPWPYDLDPGLPNTPSALLSFARFLSSLVPSCWCLPCQQACMQMSSAALVLLGRDGIP